MNAGINLSTRITALALLSCLMLLVPVETSGEGPEVAEKQQDEIRVLVGKLGDNNYKVREEAQKKLIEIGPAAMPQVRQALECDDLEVRTRCKAILKVLSKQLADRRSRAMLKNLLWKFPVVGGVVGSPVIGDNLACFAAGDGKLYAVNLKTGKEAWSFAEFPKEARITQPVLADGNVYVYGGGRTVFAVNLATGKLVRKYELPAPAKPVQSPQRRFIIPAVPAVANGMMYIADSRGTFTALDVKTAKTRWTVSLPGSGGGRPAITDKIACVACSDGTLVALNAKTGKQLWKFKGNLPVRGAVIRDGTVYFVSGGNLYAKTADTGKDVWVYRVAGGQGDPAVKIMLAVNRTVVAGQRSEEPLVFADGVIHAISGSHLVGIDAKKGKEKWRYELACSDNKAGGMKIQMDNGIIMVAAGAVGGQGVLRGIGARFTCPAICDGKAYIGTADGLRAVDLSTGRQLWHLPTSTWVSGRPIVVGGVIYFGTTAVKSIAPGRQGSSNKDAQKSPDKKEAKCGLHAVRLSTEKVPAK